MKQPRLSALFVAVSAASLLAMSTASFAAHKYHHHKAVAVAEHDDFKGEANYKAEVPPPCPPVMLLRDGFYIGAGVGYDSYRLHHTLDTSEVDIATGVLDSSTSQSDSRSGTGWMGGLFAGYGHYFDWFYLGGEINANVSNAEGSRSFTSSDGDAFHETAKARGSYGIALLPGIKVNDSSLLYARLGYLRTDFKSEASATVVDEDDGSVVASSISDSNWRNGFNYGVGIETYVAENVSVRGEFTHTVYNEKTATRTFTTDTDQFTSSLKLKPSNNEFMLSLLYHFC